MCIRGAKWIEKDGFSTQNTDQINKSGYFKWGFKMIKGSSQGGETILDFNC